MTVLDILTAARAILEEMAPEVRNRCADTTHMRLQGVIQSLETAASLAVAAPGPGPAEPAPGATAEAQQAPAAAAQAGPVPVAVPDMAALQVMASELVKHLGPDSVGTLIQVMTDRIALEVRAAMDAYRAEAEAQAQAQAQG